MADTDFIKLLVKIQAKDPRYPEEAYFFVREGLEFCMKNLKNDQAEVRNRHVSGKELLEGLKDYGHQTFGPMCHKILRYWNVHKTEDFGNIVFNMVEAGILGKTESDSKEEFARGYTFEEAFLRPYLPQSKLPKPLKK